jgi:hypothetical protein
MFSDETTFYVSGRVNRHTCRIWGSENPHVIREIERGSANANVWYALSCSEVLGPFFFPEQTVTAMAYLDILQLYLLPQLEDRQPNVAFQEYGAPPHWAHIVGLFVDMGAGLGVMNQFRGLRTHPILYRLISSSGDTLRTLFTRFL